MKIEGIISYMSSTLFLSSSDVYAIREQFGTPVFVYDQAVLEQSAAVALSFPNAFGLTVRFAMKALPSGAVLQIFHRAGLYLDASSGYEAERAMCAGIPADHIQITAQEMPVTLSKHLL